MCTFCRSNSESPMLRSAKCVANRAAELAKAGTRKHASVQLAHILGEDGQLRPSLTPTDQTGHWALRCCAGVEVSASALDASQASKSFKCTATSPSSPTTVFTTTATTRRSRTPPMDWTIPRRMKQSRWDRLFPHVGPRGSPQIRLPRCYNSSEWAPVVTPACTFL